MNTVTSTKPTGPAKDTADLTLTPLPRWQAMAETVLRKDMCGQLCAHGCLSGASSTLHRHHQA
ncbi:hypothetical protein ABT234_06180 [Streptomyces sp. NPDC001586]|uniref:hypothetical protein n=1 Tax=unclassified Streptomyces TaxID=2593676 RepID=UPI00332E0D01